MLRLAKWQNVVVEGGSTVIFEQFSVNAALDVVDALLGNTQKGRQFTLRELQTDENTYRQFLWRKHSLLIVDGGEEIGKLRFNDLLQFFQLHIGCDLGLTGNVVQIWDDRSVKHGLLYVPVFW